METNTHDASEDARPDVACSAELGRGRHTPGPWGWVTLGSGHSPYLRAMHSGALVVMNFARMGMQGAEPRFSDRNGELRGGIMRGASEIDIHTHPDARLIAAAPELLEAALYAAWRADPYSEAYYRLTASIAKATGSDVTEVRKALAKDPRK